MSIAAAVLGSGLISGVANIFGARAGAAAQTRGANRAIKLQKEIMATQLALQKPYLKTGEKAAKGYRRSLAELTAPVDLSPLNMDQAALEKTPGYQFTLSQGEKAVRSSLAARGLAGSSGAFVKGAETYAAGLADKTFQERWQNAMDRIKTQMDSKRLRADIFQNIFATGTNAASNAGVAIGGQGTGIAQSLANIGNVQAGAAVATGQAVGDIASAGRDARLAQGVYGNLSTPVQQTGPFSPKDKSLTPGG